METLREISIKHAKKQPQQVEYLTEESPILDVTKWTPASHDFWNAAERIPHHAGAAAAGRIKRRARQKNQRRQSLFVPDPRPRRAMRR